ncbi:MAG: Do family serine endopeptidase [Planctomycetota bacterium]|jgi:serine protease Do|nr:Do family serine endopeptidase [Planctomycetota bacterium]
MQFAGTKFAPALLALALFACALRAPAATPQLTREEQAALASVNTLSRAFTGVAKIIRPAVVNIKVERRVAVGRNGGFNDPMEFFSEMFGQGFPGFPQRQSQQTRIGQGSGVIVDPAGYILTNNHVVGDADAIRVILLDGRELPAELIGADPGSDVAVIKIHAENLTSAQLGDSDIVEVGEWVLAVGNPFGLDFTVTSGIISARGRSGMNVLEMEDFLQTDAAINPGNSGGPLVNLKGEVIGINSFIYTPQANSGGPFGGSSGSGGSVGVGFAIPSNMAKSIMQSLISHKQITSAYLGVETQPLTPDLAQAFGMQSPKGALVQAVNRDSPAEKAGMRRGDVVVRWGRREIDDDQQFRNLVTITTPGEPIEVEVIREGKSTLLEVVLAANAPEVVIEGRSDRFLQNLGIEVSDLTPELREEIGYDESAFGVLVTSVMRNSPARQMGFQPGSLIMTVNGTEVRSAQALKNILGSSERVKAYTLVWRNGDFLQRVTLSVN